MKIPSKTTLDPICSAVKFKLAVFTVPAKALACSMSCDLCQPTKFKGTEGYPHMWVLDTLSTIFMHSDYLESPMVRLEQINTLSEKHPH